MVVQTNVFLGALIFLFILVTPNVYAQMSQSNVGVDYEDRILEEFEANEYVGVIIYLKDSSEISNLISDFSDEEMKNVINRDTSNRIAADISEDAFFKLIEDERVDRMYYNRPIYALNKENSLYFLIGMVLALIILILIYILFKISKKRRYVKR